MAYDAAEIQSGLREYIGITRETTYQNEADFFPMVKREAEEVPVNLRGRREPLEVGSNQSLTVFNPDGGILASPHNLDDSHLTINYQSLCVGISINYSAMLQKNTIDNPTKRNIDGAMTQLAKWLNIYTSQGDGTSALARTSAAYSGGTPTIVTCNGATDVTGTTNVKKGFRYQLYDPTGATLRSGGVGAGPFTINSETGTAITASSNQPTDFLANDILCPEGGSTTIKGVPFINNNTGTYFGQNRATERSLQATIVNAAGALTAALLLRTYLLVEQKSGVKEGGLQGLEMFYGITQKAAYFNLVTPSTSGSLMRFVHSEGSRPNVDVGGSTMNFSFFGVRMRRMLDWLGTRIDFLDIKRLKIALLKDMGDLADEVGGDWLRAVDSNGNYLAQNLKWLDFHGEMFARAPHRFGALTGLDVTGLPMPKSA